ncbi:MAG: MFS transporter [Anaerolineae bacterium]|nr:MFS transporter [Anaerolineae bacterium]
MKQLRNRIAATGSGIWTPNLIFLAVSVFMNGFGQGVLGGARTNFFVDTLGLTGGQVLWLEGIREIPGLALIFIAALTMRLPLSRRAAAAVLIMGIGYALYAPVNSYNVLLAMAVFASLGMHMWFPLQSTLGMQLAPGGRTGQVLGTLASVTALSGIVGMGAIALMSALAPTLSLRLYYVIGGVLIIIAAFLLLRIPKDVGVTKVSPPRMLVKGRYWLYYVLTFFQGSRKQVLNTFGMLVLVENFGFEVWQISTIMVASSIVNLVGAPRLGRLLDRFGERRVMTTSYLLLILCCAGFAFLHAAWMLVILLIIIKLLVTLEIGLDTYIYHIAPPEELTPTLSAGISINHVTSVAMPIVAGALLPAIGYEGIFLGAAGLILLSAPFALSLKPRPASQPAATAAT